MTKLDNAGKASPTISEYMTRNVKTISVNATLKELSQAFIDQGVSALLVTDGNEYVGIVSDKRLTREGVAKGLNIETTTVKAIMRSEMLQIDSQQPVREAQAMMKANGVRHLVVTETGKIVGIVTISDLIRYFSDFFEG
ncbi:MAG: CBS domain-containing protein [Nitrospirales bacterium]|nr:CBS domain-containing protein [Nitrospirales bacterium]